MMVHAWLLVPVIAVSWLGGFAARGALARHGASVRHDSNGFIDAVDLQRRSLAADHAMERINAAADRAERDAARRARRG